MSELQVFNCEQGTPEWHACRIGIPTASEFDTVMRKGGKGPGGTSIERRTYMLKLIGERLTGEAMEGFTNQHTERGHEMEPAARAKYAFQQNVEPVQVGFLRRGRAGASPDSLVDEDGLLEIKTKLPHLQLDVLDRDEIPSTHVPQLQGQLWISGRKWVDFVSYWPKLPLFVKRLYRDEQYITDLALAVAKFNDELDALMRKLNVEPLAKAA